MIDRLSEDLAARFVDRIGQHTKRSEVLWRMRRRLLRATALMRAQRDDDEAAAAVAHALGAVGNQIAGRLVANDQRGAVRCEEIAVGQFHRTQPDR